MPSQEAALAQQANITATNFSRTDALRWERRGERHMLQQAWFRASTGEMEWRDVPMVIEKIACTEQKTAPTKPRQKAVS